MLGDVMSQLGRLDVGEIILRIGSTLDTLTSKFLFPSLFTGNIYPLLDDLSKILHEIQSGNIDFNLLSLVADDTKPFLETSNWSVLKTVADQLKSNTESLESKTGKFSEHLTSKPNSIGANENTNNYEPPEKKVVSINLVQLFGDAIETALHFLRFLPEEHTARITGHKFFTMLRFIISTFYEIVKTSSTKELQDFFDLAESLFYTISDEEKGQRAFDLNFWKKTLCNKTEFLNHLTIPQRIDPTTLQEFACNISTTFEKVLSWWPSLIEKNVKAEGVETSDLVNMLEFLVKQHPTESIAQGSKSSTIRTKLLRLQVAFGNFVENVAQKTNLTDSLIILLRVMHSAFPSSSQGKKVVPIMYELVYGVAKQLRESEKKINGSSGVPQLANFIRSSISGILEISETYLWKSMNSSTLASLAIGREEFCLANGNELLIQTLCSSNSTLKNLRFSEEKLNFKKKELDLRWNQFRQDMDYIENIIRSLKDANLTHKIDVASIIAGINGVMSSLNLFLPLQDCSFKRFSLNSTLCFILRFQNSRLSLEDTTNDYDLAIKSLNEGNKAFIWNTLTMVAKQTFNLSFAHNIDEQSKEELLETLDALSFSYLILKNSSEEINYDSHVRLAFMVVKLIGSKLESDYRGARSFFHTFHSMVNLFVNRIQTLAAVSHDASDEKTIVEVEEVFPDAPVTQKVVKSLFPHLPEVLSTLFWTSLAQGKLHHLASESQRNLTIVTKLLCNDTITDYLYNPSFHGPEEWKSLMSKICAHPYFKVFEELLEDPDIQAIIFESDNADDPIEWDELKQGVFEFTSLVMKLKKERKLDTSVLPPSEMWNELLVNITQPLEKPSVAVYVFLNSMLYRFCDSKSMSNGKFSILKSELRLPQLTSESNITSLSSTLCSMSTSEFADKAVANFMRLLHTQNWRGRYDILLNTTNMRPILKSVFGNTAYQLFGDLDIHILTGWNFTDGTAIYKGVLYAARKLYLLADHLAAGNISQVLFKSPSFHMLESLSLIENDESLKISDIPYGKLQKVLKVIFAPNKEKPFYQFLFVLSEYFAMDEHSFYLSELCLQNITTGNSTFDANITTETIEVKDFICQNDPTTWVNHSRNTFGPDVSKKYESLANLVNTIRNETLRFEVQHYIKSTTTNWTKDVLNTLYDGLLDLQFDNTEGKLFKLPKTYFSLIRSFLKVAPLVLSNDTNLAENCVPTNWSLLWSQMPNKLFSSISDAEYLLCNVTTQNISTVYKGLSDVLNLKNFLTEYGKVLSTNWSMSCPNMKAPTIKLASSWLIDGIAMIERVFVRIFTDPVHRSNILACSQNISSSMLFRDFAKFSNITKHFARLVSNLRGSKSLSRDWKDVEKQIVSFVVPQLPAFSRVSSFLNLTSYAKSENGGNTMNMPSKYILKILEQSSFNLNWLSQQNFSSSSLKRAFCGPPNEYLSQGVIQFPPVVTSREIKDVVQFLCNGSGFDLLLSRLNVGLVHRILRESQEREFYSGQWFRKLFMASSGIVDNVVQLVRALTQLVSKSPSSSQYIIDTISSITRSSAIQEVFNGLSGIVQKLTLILGGSPLLNNLQQILDGIQAFQSLQRFQLFEMNLKVKELFMPNEIKHIANYWVFKYKLNDTEANDRLESELDLHQVLDLFGEEKRNTMCLHQAESIVDDHNIQHYNVSLLLCGVPQLQSTFISSDALRDIIMGKFLKNVGELGLKGILQKADVNLEDAKKVLEVLGSAGTIIPHLESQLGSLLNVLEPDMRRQLTKLNITQHGVTALGTSEALAASGQILCGKPLRTLQRKFSLLTLGDNKEPDIDETELQNLPNAFCKNGYKQVLNMPGGAILWGFLKPLFRGKILYAPKHLPAAQIVISEVNKTFESIAEYIQLFQAVAEGSTGLHYLEIKKELISSIQELLSSKPIAKLLGPEALQISGIFDSGNWSGSWFEDKSSATILELVTLVGNVSQCITLNRFVGYDSELELERAASKLHGIREFIAAIVFLNTKENSATSSKNTPIPYNIQYKIRMDIDNVPTAKEIRHRWWRPYPYDNFFDDFRYFRGFIQLQELIDTAITRLHTIQSDSAISFRKYLQQFPYPCHQQDKFGTVLKGSLPGMMTVSWIFLIAFLVRDKVLEKELFLQEILGVMGLNPMIAWLSWFLTGLFTMLVSVSGIVLIMKWGGITPLSDPVILFLFLFDFAVLLIAYCHLMSVLFQKAAAAALVAIVIYVLSFFPFLLFVTWELYFLFWHKILACCLVATSFCFGCLYLNRLEDQGQGVQWDNLWVSPIPDDSMSMGLALVAMATCSLVYFITAAYISEVKKNENQTKKSSWLMFVAPFYFGRKTSAAIPLVQKETFSGDGKVKELPKISSHNAESVSIRNLKVIYSGQSDGKEKEAIQNLNLGLHEEQIATLLGHNGAGKTTTIKVLTGRLCATAGNVSVYGIQVSEHLSEARKLIGYCPQYNTLFGKLTVREHLYLFAHLKGVLSGDQLEHDIDEMVNCLGLQTKQNEYSENLSGGQKRRLCVGMAFVGGSKFIVLDEPTSSVDPLARRSIWDLIVQYRNGRTILLTTHHLDEADILSDQVAILHRGKLLCCGTPLMLKSKFGSGYKLSLFASMVSNSTENDNPDDVDSGNASSFTSAEEADMKNVTDVIGMDGNGVMEFIQSFFPSASLLENDGSRLVVSIPQLTTQKVQKQKISDLFQNLDANLNTFGFKHYSLSSTSLEEVFLTLCNLEDARSQYTESKPWKNNHSPEMCNVSTHKKFYSGNKNVSENGNFKWTSLDKIQCGSNFHSMNRRASFSVSQFDCSMGKDLLTGYRLALNQFRCLLAKRMLHTRRNWKMVLSGILMPCLFIALAMGLAVGRPARRPEPCIQISPTLYTSRTAMPVSFYSSDTWTEEHVNLMFDSLLHGNNSDNVCYSSAINNDCDVDMSFNTSNQWCLCTEKDECSISELEHVPFLVKNSHEVFFNFTGMDTSQQLLNTYVRFNEKRYGGWSMLSKNSNSRLFQLRKSSEEISKIWFDNSGYHSAPSYLNALNNAILKASVKKQGLSSSNNDDPFEITTFSHPMQLSAEQLGQETLLQRLGEIGIAFVFLIGLSLVPSSSSVYLVRESSLEEKRVQIASGVHPLLYWIAHCAWDLMSLFLTTLFASTVIYFFALPPFVYRLNFSAVISLVLFFGWASIPLMYVCSRFFKEGSLAFMVLFTTNLFVGLVVLLVVISLHMLNISSDAERALFLIKRMALVFPQWSLLGGLTALTQNQLQSDIFKLFGQDTYVNPFRMNMLMPNFIALIVEGCFFFVLNIALEMEFFSKLSSLYRSWKSGKTTRKVMKDKQGEILKLKNISQVYQSQMGANYAVNNVTLGIFSGECFGLVGANGAGKTTLFRILSGQMLPTSGSIIYASAVRDSSNKRLGYCPQTDALDELLSPREHLQLYAQLKGVKSKFVTQVVEEALTAFDLSGHSDFSVQMLSGGTKRKLCTAIAMIGEPAIVLLDEPTSGMDPGSRRLVWKSIIKATLEKQTAVILSSHSIEECDILCSRIGIMVNGQIQCLGTPQELKNTYGSGVTISFRAPNEDSLCGESSPILKFIKSQFPSAELKARHCSTIEFSLPKNDRNLAKIFQHLEQASSELGLQDITVNHTTLDQVFVGFVRQQSDGTQTHQREKNIQKTQFQMNSFINNGFENSQNEDSAIVNIDGNFQTKL